MHDSTAKGCYRDAVRSTKEHVIHCFGLKWVAMMLLVPVLWARRVWALPFLAALCWPADKAKGQRHKTSVDWVWQMMQQVRRWWPGRKLVLVVDGGFAAVSLACVKRQVVMVSRLWWDAAPYHPHRVGHVLAGDHAGPEVESRRSYAGADDGLVSQS